jgi:hypothetical protein
MADRFPHPVSPGAKEATAIIRRASASIVAPGTVIGGTFEIETLLARGSTGDVYRARFLKRGTRHAIKVISPRLAGDPSLAGRLAELGRVRDDAVASYEGLLRGYADLRFIIMEFAEGDSLAKMLDQRRLEPDEVARLCRRVAKGLAAAHENGIVHRALRPDKIILPGRDIDGAKLIGFSLENPAEADSNTPASARPYAFLSPEQIGLFGGQVDARSDIYSLGLVLAAAATGAGAPLLMGSDKATAADSRRSVPDLSPIPAVLRPLIAPLLEPRPENRPPSTRQLAQDTKPPRNRSLSGGAEKNRHVLPPRVRRSRPPVGKALGIAAVAAAVVAVAAVGLTRRHTPSQPAGDLRSQIAAATMGYKCASISYELAADRSVRVSGHVSTAQDLEQLRHAIGDLPGIGPLNFNVGLMAWPNCEVSAMLGPLLTPPGRDAPRLSPAAQNLHTGDRLVIDGRAPAFDGYVYVDYYGSDGQVVHFLPTARDRFNLKPLRNHFILGCQRSTPVTLDGAAGQRLITLITTSKPLLTDLRPGTEPARLYLGSLSTAIGGLGPAKTAAVMTFFDLHERRSDPAVDVACPAK